MSDYVLARRAEGIHRFQLKIGDPALDAVRAHTVVENTGDEDIIGDATRGWRLNEASGGARWKICRASISSNPARRWKNALRSANGRPCR